MTRQEIFTIIKNEIDDYDIRLLEDNIFFEKDDGNCKFTFAIRCQYFGYTNMFSLGTNEFLNRTLENNISSYIFDPLLSRYDNGKTIGANFNDFNINPKEVDRFIGYEVTNYREFDLYIDFLKKIMEMNRVKFFDELNDAVGIAKFMSKFSFPQRDEFSVGGTFPCQIMKKIIILYLGGQKERYLEYCEGLESLFELYSERKPDKKEELALFKEGYKFMKEKLNSSALPTENSCY